MTKKIIIRISILLILCIGIGFILKGNSRLSVALSKKGAQKNNSSVALRDGDIIFQTTQSRQCQAVQLATHSKYSHCGLVFKRKTGNDEWSVLEAIQPVKWTALSEFVARGQGGHYVIKRLNADSTTTQLVQKDLKKIAESYLGKEYDIYFNWSDENIYCSEIVWKSYYRLNKIKVGNLKLLKDFDLDHAIVQEIMKERYGNNIPYKDTVVSPQDVFDAKNLVLVAEN